MCDNSLSSWYPGIANQLLSLKIRKFDINPDKRVRRRTPRVRDEEKFSSCQMRQVFTNCKQSAAEVMQQHSGFRFQHPQLKTALAAML